MHDRYVSLRSCRVVPSLQRPNDEVDDLRVAAMSVSRGRPGLEISGTEVCRRYLLQTRRIHAAEVTSVRRYNEMSGQEEVVVHAGRFRNIAIPSTMLAEPAVRTEFRHFVAHARAAGAAIEPIVAEM